MVSSAMSSKRPSPLPCRDLYDHDDAGAGNDSHVNLHTDNDGNDRSNIASMSVGVNLCGSRHKMMTPFMLSRPPSMNVT